MIKNIAIASLLLSIAAISALITQSFMFWSTTAIQAADVQPFMAIAASAQCAKATWPDIPVDCLERVEARKLTITMVAQ